MTGEDDDFLRLLRATFKVEADEHLQAISAALLQLEKSSSAAEQRPTVERVFRAAHTLKGAARAADFLDVESVCQSMEEVFASWKQEESAVSPAALDVLHRAVDAIASSLSATATPQSQIELASLRRSLQQIGPAFRSSRSAETTEAAAFDEVKLPSIEPRTPSETSSPALSTPAEETVRVEVRKLETQLLEAEEILSAKLTASQRADDIRELTSRFEGWRKAWVSIEADVRALQQVPGLPAAVTRVLQFFQSSADTMKSLEHQLVVLGCAARRDRDAVGKHVDDLLENSKKLLLMPFATIAALLPKLVRDLCRDEGKEADLTIRGEEVQVDKRILEEIKDPLIHLLRNTIAHGIEKPEQRIARGKPRRGSITIDVSQVDGNKVQVLLIDDGTGIDAERVKRSAIRQNAISAEEAAQLDDAAAHHLIFESAVSTSPIITEVSGRGLGLAIVREKAEALGGEATVESKPGEGTTFRIMVPATRSRFRGILLEAGGRLLIVPTMQVDRVGQAKREDIRTIEGRETISIGERAVPLVRLTDSLDFPGRVQAGEAGTGTPIIVLGTGDHRVAYEVDAVLGEEEVLVKPLQKPLSRVRNVSAVTVLASGALVPILNVPDVLKSARKTARRSDVVAAGGQATTVRSILVAEDSITSRMLLKSILESAGYRVTTAVDGIEAFTRLREHDFDLVVSDVEMPRLSGFDLTERIRADAKLAELPVVLVTALASREHRERGIDVGANAYIVKGSFDQSNLLEAVRRLI